MKSIVSLIIIFFCSGVIFSQSRLTEYSIDSLLEYNIKSIEMGKIIDSTISITSKCFYYEILQKPYMVWVCINDSSKIEIDIIPFSYTLISSIRSDDSIKEEGIYIHNEQFVFITSPTTKGIEYFFTPTGKKKNWNYKNSLNIFDHSYPTSVGVRNYYEIIDGKIISSEYDSSRCGNEYFFYYMTNYGDTWMNIATECSFPVDALKKLYPEMETPIPGYLIMIRYYVDKDNSVGIERVL